jgi:uncharacterized membrane protein YphA (DoxX/SURF4 family)
MYSGKQIADTIFHLYYILLKLLYELCDVLLWQTIMKRIFRTANPPILFIRLAVGLIFLSEGLQKYILPGTAGTGRFAKIGFENPAFWAYFTGSFEIVCGILVVTGLFTRLAAVPLITIMIVAFVTTKVSLLADKGFWAFAHEYRTDFAMTLLLLFLLIYDGGNNPVDKRPSHP